MSSTKLEASVDGGRVGKLDCSINALPNEILAQIFHLVSNSSEDMPNVMLVCMRWRAIGDETVGRVCKVKTEEDTVWMRAETKLCHLQSVGLRSLNIEPADYIELEQIHPPRQGFEAIFPNRAVLVPSLKLPQLLQSMKILGGISVAYLKSLTVNLINLEILELDAHAIWSIGGDALTSQHWSLPNLKTLKIYKSDEDVPWHDYESVAGQQTLNRFLTVVRFERLKSIMLHYVENSIFDLTLSRVIVNFLIVHKKIEKLTVVLDLPWEYDLTNIGDFDAAMQQGILVDIRRGEVGQALKSFDVSVYRNSGMYAQFPIWRELLLVQSNLQSITVGIGSLGDETLRQICSRNCHSLEFVSIYCLDRSGEVAEHMRVRLNCHVFSTLKRIEVLRVKGSISVYGVAQLPGTLRQVYMEGVMSTEGLEHILFNIENLRHVEIHDCSNREHGVGLSYNTLCNVVNARQFETLILSGACLCRNFPLFKNTIPNGDPINPDELELHGCWDYEFIGVNWKLGSNGYYVDG